MIALNGGLLSQAITLAPLTDGCTPTYFVAPNPQVTFTAQVPPSPPAP